MHFYEIFNVNKWPIKPVQKKINYASKFKDKKYFTNKVSRIQIKTQNFNAKY